MQHIKTLPARLRSGRRAKECKVSMGDIRRIFGGMTYSKAGKGHARVDSNLYARIIRQARPYWLHVVGVFLLGTMASPIGLLLPLPLKIAVDSAIGTHPL